MKILIAGTAENTLNYQAALKACHIDYDVSLYPRHTEIYDRLLLPGGGDIHPSRFHQPDQGCRNINLQLDKAQFALLDTFIQTSRPVLGICRGLQLINVYFGGDIIQHLPSYPLHEYNQNDQHHPVFCLPDSILHQLYGDTCLVNSAHHQGCGKIGHHLTVTQFSSDGVVEGLEHTKNPVLGVQWHPERTGFSFFRPGIADGELLIRYFLSI